MSAWVLSNVEICMYLKFYLNLFLSMLRNKIILVSSVEKYVRNEIEVYNHYHPQTLHKFDITA